MEYFKITEFFVKHQNCIQNWIQNWMYTCFTYCTVELHRSYEWGLFAESSEKNNRRCDSHNWPFNSLPCYNQYEACKKFMQHTRLHRKTWLIQRFPESLSAYKFPWVADLFSVHFNQWISNTHTLKVLAMFSEHPGTRRIRKPLNSSRWLVSKYVVIWYPYRISRFPRILERIWQIAQ